MASDSLGGVRQEFWERSALFYNFLRAQKAFEFDTSPSLSPPLYGLSLPAIFLKWCRGLWRELSRRLNVKRAASGLTWVAIGKTPPAGTAPLDNPALARLMSRRNGEKLPPASDKERMAAAVAADAKAKGLKGSRAVDATRKVVTTASKSAGHAVVAALTLSTSSARRHARCAVDRPGVLTLTPEELAQAKVGTKRHCHRGGRVAG